MNFQYGFVCCLRFFDWLQTIHMKFCKPKICLRGLLTPETWNTIKIEILSCYLRTFIHDSHLKNQPYEISNWAFHSCWECKCIFFHDTYSMVSVAVDEVLNFELLFLKVTRLHWRSFCVDFPYFTQDDYV